MTNNFFVFSVFCIFISDFMKMIMFTKNINMLIHALALQALRYVNWPKILTYSFLYLKLKISKKLKLLWKFRLISMIDLRKSSLNFDQLPYLEPDCPYKEIGRNLKLDFLRNYTWKHAEIFSYFFRSKSSDSHKKQLPIWPMTCLSAFNQQVWPKIQPIAFFT